MALSSINKVRLRIGDTSSQIFTDAQIQDFLDEQGGDIFFAAADALDAMAADAALIVKYEMMGSHILDTRSIPTALREQAKQLRLERRTSPAVSIAEVNSSAFAAEEILLNDSIRTSS